MSPASISVSVDTASPGANSATIAATTATFSSAVNLPSASAFEMTASGVGSGALGSTIGVSCVSCDGLSCSWLFVSGSVDSSGWGSAEDSSVSPFSSGDVGCGSSSVGVDSESVDGSVG